MLKSNHTSITGQKEKMKCDIISKTLSSRSSSGFDFTQKFEENFFIWLQKFTKKILNIIYNLAWPHTLYVANMDESQG